MEVDTGVGMVVNIAGMGRSMGASVVGTPAAGMVGFTWHLRLMGLIRCVMRLFRNTGKANGTLKCKDT